MTQLYKTFNDLKFHPHHLLSDIQIAHLYFKNGYGVAIIINEIEPYRLRVIKDNKVIDNVGGIVGSVSCFTKDDVTNKMKEIQDLNDTPTIVRRRK